MKNGKGFCDVIQRQLERAEAKHRAARTSVATPQLRMLLEQSRMTLTALTQALADREQHLSAAHKKLAILTQANTQLRRELKGIEKKATIANHLAFHDPLTGLPNRRLLMDRLSQAIAQASRQKKSVALVFFDVNGFKAINDKLGHSHGDKLLRIVAQRLCACLRAADTACRYGGDEFIVLLPEIDGEQNAAVVQQKIRAQLAAPYLLNGKRVRMTLSIGSAVYPADAKDRHDLIRLADAAMYCAKASGVEPPNQQARFSSSSMEDNSSTGTQSKFH